MLSDGLELPFSSDGDGGRRRRTTTAMMMDADDDDDAGSQTRTDGAS